MLNTPRPPDWFARSIKRLMYGQLSVLDGLRTLVGKHDPALSFSILADPPSIYFNFEIPEARLQSFTDYINLSEGLTLAPIVCLEGDSPAFYLTLNIYEVSGLVSGPRAEWSTYIADPEGLPRYLVLEAQAAKGSMDPVNLVTRAGSVMHRREGDLLQSEVVALDGNVFSSQLDCGASCPTVRPAAQWIAANDYIYWRNGVCDRVWYNASLFDATVQLLPKSACQIYDHTHWRAFVGSQPRHVLQFEGGLDLMVSPWYNV